jgi:hypothetical protein
MQAQPVVGNDEENKVTKTIFTEAGSLLLADSGEIISHRSES